MKWKPPMVMELSRRTRWLVTLRMEAEADQFSPKEWPAERSKVVWTGR